MPAQQMMLTETYTPSQVANIFGVNFAAGGESALSYENFPIYKNRIRESRGFTVASNISVWCALTSAGWPAVDFSVVVWEGSIVPSWLTSGTFKCGFIGTGSETISVPTGVTGTVANVVHGTGGAYTTFDFTASATCGFAVTGTTGGVTNVFCYLPEYPAATIDNPVSASAFTTESIAHYSQFRHIRWMQYANALNNSQQSTSTTRRSSSNTQTQQGWNGVQYVTINSTPQGATNTNFATAFTSPSGLYSITFEETTYESRLCTCTQGSTYFSWTGGLTATPTTTVFYSTEGYPLEWQVAFCAACNIGGWFNFPIYEDGANGSAGSYTTAALAVIASGMPSGKPIIIEIGNENWNFDYATHYTLVQLASQYGYSTPTQYLGYRLHQLASACRTQFGSNFGVGKQVGLVLAWQQTVSGLDGIYDTLTYMASTYDTPNADVQYVSAAPYVLPSVGNTDSISTIEGYVAAYTIANEAGESGPKNENYAVMALKYGMQLIAYESGAEWNAVNQNAVNVGAAIMDSGMTAALETYYQTVFNSGYVFDTHFTSGVAATGGNLSPTNEFSNNYATFIASGSPTLAALQYFINNGPTFTRNVVSGSGSVIQGYNFADNVVTAPALGYNGAYQTSPYLYTNGYVPYLINCTAPGNYSLVLNTSNGAGAATTNVEINGTIIYTGLTVNSGNNTLGSVTLVKGPNYVLLGNGTQGTQNQDCYINTLTFN